ncbi:YitT family protein [Caloramator sp. mosi_1]|uniref:YitT family protein n=1 Tax=Caloramator sp. mosi_1 TaxID=3023090 RepID=UPI00235E4812|nr:YitT family protein [Caloramator sp. mosi_1]WDC84216.1 YitT family protein [Caloramator sp. mosi_1]
MKKAIKEYIFITIGIFLVAVGIYYFLVPSNLAAGGVSGLAIVINQFFPALPVGLLMLGMNIILFIIAFIVIGSNFGAKTIYSSLGLSGMIWLLEKLYPISQPVVDDLLLQLLFGILISGIGMGIVFNQNASTGGTDIIAKIINKFFHIDIGKSLLLSDFLITLAAGLTFGPKIGMYALLGVVINGFVIDNVIQGLNVCKQVTIISSKSEDIKKYIIEELGRGVTIYDGRGAFTGEKKEVLMTIISRKEFIKLREFIKELDKRAFISVSNVHEVLGEGFTELE